MEIVEVWFRGQSHMSEFTVTERKCSWSDQCHLEWGLFRAAL